MANLHSIYLQVEDVRETALPILKKRFKKYGFEDVDVSEVETLSGDPIIRMVAHVESRVPARTLIDANGDIHVALREKGDERFVFLLTRRPNDDLSEGDEDAE